MIDANPTELANDLRRIAKVSYGATIEEARSVIKTQRQAADLIEQQAARIVGLLDQHAGDSAELRLLCYERDKARERVKALEAKCGLLAASLAQSEGEVEERDTRIAALAPVATAVDAQPVAWLVTSKRGLVRTAWTQKPSPDQLAVCDVDGDTVTRLFAAPQSEGLRKDAERRSALEEGYALGFDASAEGWNGEYPGRDLTNDPGWIKERDKDIGRVLDRHTGEKT